MKRKLKNLLIFSAIIATVPVILTLNACACAAKPINPPDRHDADFTVTFARLGTTFDTANITAIGEDNAGTPGYDATGDSLTRIRSFGSKTGAITNKEQYSNININITANKGDITGLVDFRTRTLNIEMMDFDFIDKVTGFKYDGNVCKKLMDCYTFEWVDAFNFEDKKHATFNFHPKDVLKYSEPNFWDTDPILKHILQPNSGAEILLRVHKILPNNSGRLNFDINFKAPERTEFANGDNTEPTQHRLIEIRSEEDNALMYNGGTGNTIKKTDFILNQYGKVNGRALGEQKITIDANVKTYKPERLQLKIGVAYNKPGKGKNNTWLEQHSIPPPYSSSRAAAPVVRDGSVDYFTQLLFDSLTIKRTSDTHWEISIPQEVANNIRKEIHNAITFTVTIMDGETDLVLAQDGITEGNTTLVMTDYPKIDFQPIVGIEKPVLVDSVVNIPNSVLTRFKNAQTNSINLVDTVVTASDSNDSAQLLRSNIVTTAYNTTKYALCYKISYDNYVHYLKKTDGVVDAGDENYTALVKLTNNATLTPGSITKIVPYINYETNAVDVYAAIRLNEADKINRKKLANVKFSAPEKIDFDVDSSDKQLTFDKFDKIYTSDDIIFEPSPVISWGLASESIGLTYSPYSGFSSAKEVPYNYQNEESIDPSTIRTVVSFKKTYGADSNTFSFIYSKNEITEYKENGVLVTNDKAMLNEINEFRQFLVLEDLANRPAGGTIIAKLNPKYHYVGDYSGITISREADDFYGTPFAPSAPMGIIINVPKINTIGVSLNKENDTNSFNKLPSNSFTDTIVRKAKDNNYISLNIEAINGEDNIEWMKDDTISVDISDIRDENGNTYTLDTSNKSHFSVINTPTIPEGTGIPYLTKQQVIIPLGKNSFFDDEAMVGNISFMLNISYKPDLQAPDFTVKYGTYHFIIEREKNVEINIIPGEGQNFRDLQKPGQYVDFSVEFTNHSETAINNYKANSKTLEKINIYDTETGRDLLNAAKPIKNFDNDVEWLNFNTYSANTKSGYKYALTMVSDPMYIINKREGEPSVKTRISDYLSVQRPEINISLVFNFGGTLVETEQVHLGIPEREFVATTVNNVGTTAEGTINNTFAAETIPHSGNATEVYFKLNDKVTKQDVSESGVDVNNIEVLSEWLPSHQGEHNSPIGQVESVLDGEKTLYKVGGYDTYGKSNLNFIKVESVKNGNNVFFKLSFNKGDVEAFEPIVNQTFPITLRIKNNFTNTYSMIKTDLSLVSNASKSLSGILVNELKMDDKYNNTLTSSGFHFKVPEITYNTPTANAAKQYILGFNSLKNGQIGYTNKGLALREGNLTTLDGNEAVPEIFTDYKDNTILTTYTYTFKVRPDASIGQEQILYYTGDNNLPPVDVNCNVDFKVSFTTHSTDLQGIFELLYRRNSQFIQRNDAGQVKINLSPILNAQGIKNEHLYLENYRITVADIKQALVNDDTLIWGDTQRNIILANINWDALEIRYLDTSRACYLEPKKIYNGQVFNNHQTHTGSIYVEWQTWNHDIKIT